MATNYKIPGTPFPSPEEEARNGAPYSHEPDGYDPATASYADDGYDFELPGQQNPMPARNSNAQADKYAHSRGGK